MKKKTLYVYALIFTTLLFISCRREESLVLPWGYTNLEEMAKATTICLQQETQENALNCIERERISQKEFYNYIFPQLKSSKAGATKEEVWAWGYTPQKRGFMELIDKYKGSTFISLDAPSSIEREGEMIYHRKIPIRLKNADGKIVTENNFFGTVIEANGVYRLWTNSID